MEELQKRMVVEVIREKSRFAQLELEWNALSESLGNPLLSHEWFLSCAEAFYNDGDLRVVILWSDGKVSAAAPLASKKRWGIQYLELLGVSDLNEPCGLLYESVQSLEGLLNAVLEMEHPVVLQRMTGCPTVENVLRISHNNKSIIINRPSAEFAYIPIKTTWKEFWNSLKPRRRNDFKRARKRAEKGGNIHVQIVCPDSGNLNDYLRTAFEIEASGWKGRQGSAILKKAGLRRFFETYARLTCKNKKLRLCFFKIGNTPVAMLIGVNYSNRFWVLKIGYDEKWRECSPGMQLAYETIRYAFTNNLESYEWLGSDEEWLHTWPVDSRQCASIGFYPRGAAGLFGLGMDLSGFIFRKLTWRAA